VLTLSLTDVELGELVQVPEGSGQAREAVLVTALESVTGFQKITLQLCIGICLKRVTTLVELEKIQRFALAEAARHLGELASRSRVFHKDTQQSCIEICLKQSD
jgi:hypothetical protein